MRPQVEYDEVTRLADLGLNDFEISRRTGVPRTTVRDWRSGRLRRKPGRRCPEQHDYSDLPANPYAYLLGMYLGDGCLAESRRGVFRLRIVCDSRYPGIIEECCEAMRSIFPDKSPYRLPRKGCIELSMYSKHWVCLFPQHGAGRKHQRPIRLATWQERIVGEEPEPFLRGLIHSDGCRVVACDRGVASVRYHFSNRSEDIKGLFCAALDRLGIPWTRPGDRDIAIYRKEATARLDRFIGPKR